jgi:hypothetical protein
LAFFGFGIDSLGKGEYLIGALQVALGIAFLQFGYSERRKRLASEDSMRVADHTHP